MYLLSIVLLMVLNLILFQSAAAQTELDRTRQDGSLNNLVLPADYKTGRPGELGAVKKAGSGKQTLILIAGWGFGAEVFDNFIRANSKNYTMYAVTPAGFGGTPAPPMPAPSEAAAKYSENTWTRGLVTGILKLIEKEKLKKPVIAGHFVTGSQAALDLALYHPDKVGKVIIMGGMPLRYLGAGPDTISGKERVISLEKREAFTRWYADNWFKTVTKNTWDKGNHQPAEYSADPATGQKLFDLSAKVPVPVMVRYLLEFNAYDISAHYAEIKTPVLVLLPSFSDSFLKESQDSLGGPRTREWMKNYFIESWNSMRESKNPLIEFQTVPGTHLFLWYDDPKDTYRAIFNFINNKEGKN